MLRRGAAVLLALGLLLGGAGAAQALFAPSSGPVHGTCDFRSLSVWVSGRSYSVNGSGTCIANGSLTQGTLAVNGTFDVDLCSVRSGSGAASLSLDGGFGLQSGTARVVTAGGDGDLVLLGGLSGHAAFIDVLRSGSLCPTQMVWSGTLVF